MCIKMPRTASRINSCWSLFDACGLRHRAVSGSWSWLSVNWSDFSGYFIILTSVYFLTLGISFSCVSMFFCSCYSSDLVFCFQSLSWVDEDTQTPEGWNADVIQQQHWRQVTQKLNNQTLKRLQKTLKSMKHYKNELIQVYLSSKIFCICTKIKTWINMNFLFN